MTTSDDPRTRILNAAGPIFAEKGYEAATVREICQAAGVNLAAVNYHFGGKESLYREALRRAHPAKSGPQADLAWPEGTPPQRKLHDFVHMVLKHMLDVQASPWQERLFVREIMDPTPAFQELLREHFRAGFGQLQRILDEILPPDTPPHRRHQIAFSIIGQCVYFRSSRNILPLIVGKEELEAYYGTGQLADHISRLSLAALGLGPSLTGPAEPEAWSAPVGTTPEEVQK
jgi:AcrR family transcriptional regulator